MRTHYKKQYWFYGKYTNKIYYHNPYVYVSIRRGYCRKFKTMSERRQNAYVDIDDECRYYNIRVRGNRTDYSLNPWNYDKFPGRNYKKSWKDFNRHAKQWMHNLN